MPSIYEEEVIDKMSALLSVAADTTRLKILLCLLEKEKCVKEIQEITKASQSLVSHQLKVLKKYHLVDSRKEGNFVYYYLLDDHIVEIIDSLYEHVTE